MRWTGGGRFHTLFVPFTVPCFLGARVPIPFPFNRRICFPKICVHSNSRRVGSRRKTLFFGKLSRLPGSFRKIVPFLERKLTLLALSFGDRKCLVVLCPLFPFRLWEWFLSTPSTCVFRPDFFLDPFPVMYVHTFPCFFCFSLLIAAQREGYVASKLRSDGCCIRSFFLCRQNADRVSFF